MGFGAILGTRLKMLLSSFLHLPLFLFLFPLFFVFHNYFEHWEFIPVAEAALLFIYYSVAGIVLYALFFLFFGEILKASLAVTVLLAFHFFFGAIHDSLKPFSSVYSRYSVLVPVLVMLFVVIMRLIRNSNISSRVSRYFTVLFLILIVFDAVQMASMKGRQSSQEHTITPCLNCERPDVYFIVLDGYAGDKQLQQEFQFKNDTFLLALKGLGFSIPSSSYSNYRNTPFSMASMLNMEYLTLKDFEYSEDNLNECYKKIYRNKVVSTFKSLGYHFVNNSIFDIDDRPAEIDKTFLVSGASLITSQTFVSRFKKDVYYNVLRNYFPKSPLYREVLYSDKNNNDLVFQNLLKYSRQSFASPRFVYTHIMMPHFPYYFNEQGREYTAEQLISQNYEDDKKYLSYLKYANSRILQLTRDILRHSKKLPVIIIVSDHGFRKKGFSVELSFNNLQAVFIPGRKPGIFPDHTSSVNTFSIFFNEMFRQNFPEKTDKIMK